MHGAFYDCGRSPRLIEKTEHWDSPDYKDRVTTYQYDEADRLVLETTDGWTWSYQYDAAGNLLAKERRLPSRDYLDMRVEYDYSCWR